jgi:ATP-binding cassette subfamily F protein 3
MLKASNISKSYGGSSVLRDVSFLVNDGECVGLVGPNGSGKTTLLRILAGVERADTGRVDAAPNARIGYLPQGYAHLPFGAVVGDAFPRAFAERSHERLEALGRRLASTGDPAERAALSMEYDAALATLDDVDISQLLGELGLRAIMPDEPLHALSGGEQTKLGLVNTIASAPDELLLDEPTNNLDLAALKWLGDVTAGFRGPVLLVSHDRALLDDHATAILELAPTGGLEAFDGNYRAYAAEKARRSDELWARYRRQQQRERRAKAEIRAIKDTAHRRERRSQNDFYRRKAKKVARRAVVLERRLTRELAGDDHIEKPVRRPYTVKAGLAAEAGGGDRMLAASSLRVDAGGRPLIEAVDLAIARGERLVLVGANGSGKTSLLRVLAGEAPAPAGEVRLAPSTRVGYLPQSEPAPEAQSALTPVEVVRRSSELSETEARRFLHRFLFAGDEALRPLRVLSYGERRRLALARLVLAGSNLLLLDEPTNHLDIPSREAFEAALDAYDGAMLSVTHDRFFIERFAGVVLELRDGRLYEL